MHYIDRIFRQYQSFIGQRIVKYCSASTLYPLVKLHQRLLLLVQDIDVAAQYAAVNTHGAFWDYLSNFAHFYHAQSTNNKRQSWGCNETILTTT